MQWGLLEGVRNILFPMPSNFDEMVVDNYLWGNMRFPQGSLGIMVSFADFALMQRNFDPIQLAGRALTPEELTRLGDAMDKVHAAHGVPVATERGMEMVRQKVAERRKAAPETIAMHTVTDERLTMLWLAFRAAALAMVALMAGVDPNSDAWPVRSLKGIKKDEGLADFPEENVKRFAALMKDPDTLGRVRGLFSSFKQTLASEEGKALGLRIRTALSEYARIPVQDKDAREKKYAEASGYHAQLGELCVSRYVAQRKPNDADAAALEHAYAQMGELARLLGLEEEKEA